MMWWRRAIARSMVVALLASAAHPAGAQQASERDKKKATELLRQGATLLDSKDPAQALDRFTRAYELVQSPKIHFNIGLALTALDRRAAALQALQRYLREAKEDSAARREEAARRATALRARVALVYVKADLDGASVSLDGVEQGRTPLAEPLVVDPGPHGLAVQAPGGGRTWTRSIQGDAGGTIELLASLQASPEPPVSVTLAPRPPEPTAPVSGVAIAHVRPEEPDGKGRPLHQRPWFWVAVGAGVVALAAGIIVGVSRNEKTEFSCPTVDCIRAR